jgi:hypothetical protein
MPKDPAFLFYPNDWLGGTVGMTRHLKGCYIDLLIAQFNNGPLSLDTIKTVLGQDQASWTVLSKKFKQTAEGLWSNERLATEVNKRAAYSESRRNNRKAKTKTYDESYEKDMIQHMEDRNGSSVLVPLNQNKGVQNSEVHEFYNNRRFKEQFCMTKKIEMYQLELLQQTFVTDLELKGEPIRDLQRHFVNWYNKAMVNGYNPISTVITEKKQMVL